MLEHRVEIIERLPPGYRSLFERAVGVLGADERVRGIWLSGSLATGTADAASDLDLLVAVSDAGYESFTSSWRQWLAAITPTVLAGELPFAPGSFWSITPGFERFDVVVERASELHSTLFRIRKAIVDPDGLTERIPAPEPGSGPSPAKVGALVEEWFHFSAMPETILGRGDWLLGTEHVHFLRGLIYRLFVEANSPLPPMGLKCWSAKLTPSQVAVLEGLPTGIHGREDLVSAHLALSRAFLRTARPLAREVGVDWPVDLEDAASRHVQDVLGLSDPYPA